MQKKQSHKISQSSLNALRVTMLGLGCALLLSACNEPEYDRDLTSVEPQFLQTAIEEAPAAAGNKLKPLYKKDNLLVYQGGPSVKFPTSKLTLKSPENKGVSTTNTVPFVFEVENFELGVQSSDAKSKGLANSGMGQHIHLIVDNGPYSAHYTPEFKEKITEPGHHVGIAFLSRSYHESVKEPGAYQLFQFTSGRPSPETSVDLSQPALFYSRPKGEYVGDETKSILLDFYVVNTELSPEGNQVEVTINGKDSFLISQWAPYVIEGLPMGSNTIELKLIDANGNPMPTPFGSGKQTIELKPAAAEGEAATTAHGH